MIVRKTPAEIEKMAAAGDVVARTLRLLERLVRPGVTTAELDAAAEKFIRSQGGVPTFKGYRGFPGSICASPNSMIVHGIPGPYALERGDLISLDVGVTLDGWVADAARSFSVGPAGALAHNLLEGTRESLFAAVEQCVLQFLGEHANYANLFHRRGGELVARSSDHHDLRLYATDLVEGFAHMIRLP